MAAKILTTFAIGQRYETLWNTYCKASWEHFASRHGYELVVINKMLRPDNRSPAWQKLALPEYFSNAEQVLFVDADIIFSSCKNSCAVKLITFARFKTAINLIA